MKPGYAFHFNSVAIGFHYRVVISDPEQDSDRVVVVGLTGHPSKGEMCPCIFQPGEHEWITIPTYVRYDNVHVTTVEMITKKPTGKHLSAASPLPASLVQRILNGAAVSMFTPEEALAILRTQGLIE